MNINNIKIHFSFIIYLLIVLYGGLLKESFFFLSCLIFHEIGHIVMIKITKNKIERINLTCIGFFIDIKPKRQHWIKSVLIYSGGLLNTLILHLFLISNKNNIIYNFNSFILLINILPIVPLDGYNIIYTLLTLVYEDEYLNDVFLLIGALIITFLIIFYVIFKYSFILILIIFLAFKNIKHYCERKKFLKINKILKFRSKF